MNKKDCKLGMTVAIIKNVNQLSGSKLKVKRIGKIIGIYDDFVNLILLDCNTDNLNDYKNISNSRTMYRETFRFYEIFKMDEVNDIFDKFNNNKDKDVFKKL